MLITLFNAWWCHLARWKAASLLCNAEKTGITTFLHIDQHSFRKQWLLVLFVSWAATFFNYPQICRSGKVTWKGEAVASCAAARRRKTVFCHWLCTTDWMDTLEPRRVGCRCIKSYRLCLWQSGSELVKLWQRKFPQLYSISAHVFVLCCRISWPDVGRLITWKHKPRNKSCRPQPVHAAYSRSLGKVRSQTLKHALFFPFYS